MLVANEALLFFVMGAYLAIVKPELPQMQVSRTRSLLFLTFWFCLILAKMALLYFNYPPSIWMTILHKLGIVVGIVALWSSYDSFIHLQRANILKWAPFSFFIYAFHEPVLIIFKPALFTLLGKGEVNSLLVYILAPSISILLGIFVAVTLRKLSPAFYGLITGGR